mmetsp:Transcript_31780/g.62927  ORF Transcript_31780/g.62927 Transcript_31780/m.62927 type:complete len:203 (+) Transcript_31780:634-1242(+)
MHRRPCPSRSPCLVLFAVFCMRAPFLLCVSCLPVRHPRRTPAGEKRGKGQEDPSRLSRCLAVLHQHTNHTGRYTHRRTCRHEGHRSTRGWVGGYSPCADLNFRFHSFFLPFFVTSAFYAHARTWPTHLNRTGQSATAISCSLSLSLSLSLRGLLQTSPISFKQTIDACKNRWNLQPSPIRMRKERDDRQKRRQERRRPPINP